MNFESLCHVAEEEARRLVGGFPAELRPEVESLPIFFEAFPGKDDVEMGVAEDTLGYYDNDPVPRIRLWLNNIWDYAAGDEGAFREEVQTTLLHEIGHHFGWDEEEVAERGLE